MDGHCQQWISIGTTVSVGTIGAMDCHCCQTRYMLLLRQIAIKWRHWLLMATDVFVINIENRELRSVLTPLPSYVFHPDVRVSSIFVILFYTHFTDAGV